MKIFFSKFKVIPTRENEAYDLVEGALAYCWIKDVNPQSAHAKAEFFVLKGDWQILEVEKYPIEVNESNFIGKDIGIQHYSKAKEEGISIAYLAWSRDGKTTAGPLQLKPSFNFPISEFIDSQKKLSQKGRCLHYENGFRCNEIIRAHSIQRNQSLLLLRQLKI